jgi:hypothetical protein
MSLGSVLTIEIDRIGGMEPMHGLAEITSGRPQEKVIMIGHQAKGKNLNVKTVRGLSQETQKGLTVLVLQKNVSPPIPARSHMVGGIGKLEAVRPGHGAILASEFSPVNSNVKFWGLALS